MVVPLQVSLEYEISRAGHDQLVGKRHTYNSEHQQTKDPYISVLDDPLQDCLRRNLHYQFMLWIAASRPNQFMGAQSIIHNHLPNRIVTPVHCTHHPPHSLSRLGRGGCSCFPRLARRSGCGGFTIVLIQIAWPEDGRRPSLNLQADNLILFGFL